MSFTGNAPIRRARNLLLGGDGYRSRLLLNLDDPINGRDAVTGTIFQIQDSASPSAGIYVPGGRFLQGYDANGTASWTGTRGLVSLVSSRLWDVASNTGDFALSYWFKCDTAPNTAGTQVVAFDEVPFDSNNFVVSSLSSNAGRTVIRVRLSTSQSDNFIISCFMEIPFDTNWHFAAVGRIGDIHYASVDGGAPTGSSTMNIGYRRSPGPRTVTIGKSSSTNQADATLDAIWLVDGQPFDFANGFAVPTAAPVLY